MKKILNWLFGSFFRTIGRVIAFIFIGFILAYIINSNDLLDKLHLDFLILKVNASSNTINLDQLYGNNVFFSERYCETNVGCPYQQATRSNTFYINEVTTDNIQKMVYFNFQNVMTSNNEYVLVPIYLKNSNEITFIDKQSMDIQAITKNYINTKIDIKTTNGWGTCELLTSNNNIYYYKCPTGNGNIYTIRFNLEYIQSDINLLQTYPTIQFGISELLTGYTGNASIENSINNQTQQQHQDSQNTQNAINNVNETLTDDDTSESTSEASNFFGNFSTDTHGLTGVITAPLSAIQSLTSKTCSPLVIPIPFLNNKNLTLPCMRSVYIEYFEDFMDIYDVICIGVVSYWIMVRIFNLVKDFKNPDHDEIEVMDL